MVLACVLTSAWAQDFPAGMRNEIVEIEQNEDEYSLFTYKDEDGAFGYYLSLGRVFPILEAEIFGGQTTISHMDETCLCLGATKEEALATIEQLLALLEEPAGTTAAFQCRRSSGGERLSVPDQANCVVVKRFLQGKQAFPARQTPLLPVRQRRAYRRCRPDPFHPQDPPLEPQPGQEARA